MADQISAKEHTLWDLMSGKFIFRIPDYQRPYSWTENEVSTLWDDLIEFWSGGHISADKSYFLGSIVLVKEIDSPEAEVIDGQQRLTTLSILLSLLKNKSASWGNDISKCLWEEGIQHMHIEGKPRMSLRKRDAFFFMKYISQGNMGDLFELNKKTLDDDSQRLIQINARLLSDRINETLGTEESTKSFISMLFSQCFFVVVTTPDNESAFRVFSVLNNRGLSLLPSDIIKAHIIGSIPESKRQFYSDKWEDVEVGLGREAFNALLSHIRTIFMMTRLHGTLVEEFEKSVFSEYPEKANVITDVIEPYAYALKTIMSCDYMSSTKAEDINELLGWLARVDDSDWIPVMMTVLVIFGNDSELVYSFAYRLERMAAFFYVTSKTANQRIERYAKVVANLKKKNIKEAMDIMQLSSSETTQFLNALDGDIYLLPARKRTFIMLRLDRFMSDKAANYKSNLFSIEHVLPQNPSVGSQWLKVWQDEDVREFWLHKIANLIPLTRKKNSQAQNYDFKKKKEKYFSDKNGITTYVLATDIIQENEWTPESVSARQKRLMAIYAKYWELSSSILVDNKCDSNDVKKNETEKNAELLLQERLLGQLENFFVSNPGTLLPRLPKENLKVGEYVHRAMHALCISDYLISDEQIRKLCTVSGSMKYTHRKLPFLVLADEADLESSMMKRYWKRESYIETINGKKYYVYSQWYLETKVSSDAHKSDFLQLYLDLATNKL